MFVCIPEKTVCAHTSPQATPQPSHPFPLDINDRSAYVCVRVAWRERKMKREWKKNILHSQWKAIKPLCTALNHKTPLLHNSYTTFMTLAPLHGCALWLNYILYEVPQWVSGSNVQNREEKNWIFSLIFRAHFGASQCPIFSQSILVLTSLPSPCDWKSIRGTCSFWPYSHFCTVLFPVQMQLQLYSHSTNTFLFSLTSPGSFTRRCTVSGSVCARRQAVAMCGQVVRSE